MNKWDQHSRNPRLIFSVTIFTIWLKLHQANIIFPIRFFCIKYLKSERTNITIPQNNYLNPSWQTSKSLLSGENWVLTDSTNSGLGFVNGNPKNRPEKLLCKVLFIIVPALKCCQWKTLDQYQQCNAIVIISELQIKKRTWYYLNHCLCSQWKGEHDSNPLYVPD